MVGCLDTAMECTSGGQSSNAPATSLLMASCCSRAMSWMSLCAQPPVSGSTFTAMAAAPASRKISEYSCCGGFVRWTVRWDRSRAFATFGHCLTQSNPFHPTPGPPPQPKTPKMPQTHRRVQHAAQEAPGGLAVVLRHHRQRVAPLPAQRLVVALVLVVWRGAWGWWVGMGAANACGSRAWGSAAA